MAFSHVVPADRRFAAERNDERLFPAATMSCPVDHTNMPPKSSGGCPVDHGQSSADKCPVDHTPNSTSTSTWARLFGNSSTPGAGPSLSTEREVSSIPRGAEEGNWVYPSEAQFFAAMARKNHDPHATDMKTIVPIHNAVNERAWAEIQKWEAGRGGEACGGCRLVSFQGKPTQRTPKATFMTLLGCVYLTSPLDLLVEVLG